MTTGTTGPYWTYTQTESKPSKSATHTTIMAQSNLQPPHTLNEQYNGFRQQVAAEPTKHHTGTSTVQPPQGHTYEVDKDLDMDAQLENVSPERGGSSLQISLGRNSTHSPQATIGKSLHISEGIPSTLQYRTSRLEEASESQNTKRRKAADYSASSMPMVPSKKIPPSLHTTSKKTTTLGIDMLGQMWLDFHVHEAFLIKHGKRELKDIRSDEEFHVLGTPTTEVQEFRTIRRAFPRTPQVLHP